METKITIQYRPDLDIVEAIASGVINTDSISKSGRKVDDIVQEYQCYRVLVDIRNCIVTRSKMEAFLDMERFMDLTGFSYEIKCAVVYNPGTYPDERANFIETVIRNRPNPRFRMFNNLDKSLNWLNEK